MHEILHAIGFKHSSNKQSVMYEISDCSQQLTNEIVKTINDLYKYQTLPDLIIRKATAVKSGRFLEFEIEVFNAGLDNSFNSKVGVYADKKLITQYDIGELEIGSGKIIKVGNLRAPRDFTEVSFKVDSSETVFEISEENNEKVLVIVG